MYRHVCTSEYSCFGLYAFITPDYQISVYRIDVSQSGNK